MALVEMSESDRHWSGWGRVLVGHSSVGVHFPPRSDELGSSAARAEVSGLEDPSDQPSRFAKWGASQGSAGVARMSAVTYGST